MIEYPGPEVKRGTHRSMGRTEDRRKLVRQTASVALPTLMSRILGYLRDLLQAFFLGTGSSADAFTIAFAIPSLLRRLTAEGAMNAAFVPTFTVMKKEKSRPELWRFAKVFFFDFALVMAVVAALGIVFAPAFVRVIALGFRDAEGVRNLTIVLTRTMFPYIILVSLSAVAGGILNAHGRFFIPASASILFNIGIITAVALLAKGAREPAFVFAGGVLAGGALQLGIQIPALKKEGMKFSLGLSFVHPAVRRVAALMVPGILGASVYQINFIVSRLIATSLERGSASALYYASRIEELTLGLFSIALSVVLLPMFSEQAAALNRDEMKKTVGFSLRLIALVAIPAAAGLIVLHKSIIRILFERGAFDSQSTLMSSTCLLFFALGLPFISGVKIVVPVFFSLKDTTSPVVIGSGVLVLNIGLSLILMGPLRVGGLALALSLSQIINFAALFIWMERKIGRVEKRRLAETGLKASFAAGGMAGGLLLVRPVLNSPGAPIVKEALFLAGVIVLGVCFYGAILRLISPEEARNLQTVLFRKRKERGEPGLLGRESNSKGEEPGLRRPGRK